MAATADPWLLAADLLDPPPEPTSGDLAECKADVTVFIERHASIEDPDGTVVPFTLWPFQHEPLQALQAGESIIVLKARRLGLSWVVLAFALWRAIFQQGIRILILCKNEDDATELLDRIRRMKQRISENPDSAHILAGLRQPPKLRDAVKTLDVGSSTIRALVGTPAAARSETAGLVIADEFAFQKRSAQIWRGLLPTIEGGGQIAVISTGNGQLGDGEQFHKLWSIAKQGLGRMRAMFFPWKVRPDRDEAWKADQIEALGDEDSFKVEYPEEEDEAFLSVDADLIYPGTHIDAAVRHGALLDAMPKSQRPNGPLYLGIDWGVNTHMVLARRMPSGGLYVVREVWSERADLEQDVQALAAVLDELGEMPQFVRYDPGGPGAKVIGSFRTQMRAIRPAFRPKVMKIPFATFKVVAIRYTKLLLRRSSEDKDLRYIAISPTGCPRLVRQMRGVEWKDADTGKTEKGDDDGSDALLTLTAEPGYSMFKTTSEG